MTDRIESGITREHARAARGAARREAIRRGGYAIGAGVSQYGQVKGYHVVVYVTNEVLPPGLKEPFYVGSDVDVPVVAEVLSGPPILLPG